MVMEAFSNGTCYISGSSGRAGSITASSPACAVSFGKNVERGSECCEYRFCWSGGPMLVIEPFLMMQGGYSYSGQRCTAVKVVLVAEEIADELVAKVKKGVEGLSVGMPEVCHHDNRSNIKVL